MEDFWPENIGQNQVSIPEDLLKAQAAKLGKHTKNLVLAEVSRVVPDYGSYDAGADFAYDFLITVPTLNNYQYRLFTVQHSVGLYPATIDLESDLANEINHGLSIMTVEDEEQMADLLKTILKSNRTGAIVTVLRRLATSRRQPEEEPSDDIPF